MGTKLKYAWKSLQPYIRFVIPLLFIVFIARQVVRDWNTIVLNVTPESFWWVAPGFVFFFLGVALIAWNWKILLGILGKEYAFIECFRSFYYSMLLKYIPGRIWGATGRIILAKHDGIPEGTTALSIILESLFLMTSASIVGLLVLSRLFLMPVEIRVLLVLTPIILVFLHPGMIHRGVRILSRRFPGYVIPLDAVPAYKTVVRILAQYCLVWLFQGLGFWFSLKMLVPIKTEFILICIGGNCLAWLAGFLAVFTPAGLGVREFVLTRLSSGIVNAGPAAVAAIVSRIIVVLCELTGCLFFWLIGKYKHKNVMDGNTAPD
jgi:glycosyltransferase 2 family protein